jgi:cytochrome c oxidase subunit 2
VQVTLLVSSRWFAGLAIWLAFGLHIRTAQATDGHTLFVTCQVCHGKSGEGNRKVGAPNIAGMDAWYIERQLENFAAGRRGATPADSFGAQMRGAVSSLPTAAERAAVATTVAALPKVGAGGTARVASVAEITNGRTHFNALCSSCHGASGAGNQTLGAPRLAGVDNIYLARQFVNFRTAIRGMHADDKFGKQMVAISKMLPDAKAERDVMAYIATLKP